jgi:hypothetical protein
MRTSAAAASSVIEISRVYSISSVTALKLGRLMTLGPGCESMMGERQTSHS